MRLKDDNKREAIRQATFQLAAQKGLSGLKMGVIAEQAGMSPSTLYVYFKDKEDLIQTLFQEVTQKLVAVVMTSFETGLPYKLSLKKVWKAYLNFQLQNYEEVLFYEQVKRSSVFGDSAIQTRNVEMAAALPLLELGIKQTLLKNINPQLMVAVLGGMTHRMTELFASGGMEATEENIELCFQLLWDSIKA